MARKPTLFRVIVEEMPGVCHAGYKPGDVFEFKGIATPDGFCGGAYHALFPLLFAMNMGQDPPWEKEPGVGHSMCPDPQGKLVFRVEAIRDQSEEA
ncbi:MAG: TIGR04076 family protein [bacterium]